MNKKKQANQAIANDEGLYTNESLFTDEGEIADEGIDEKKSLVASDNIDTKKELNQETDAQSMNSRRRSSKALSVLKKIVTDSQRSSLTPQDV